MRKMYETEGYCFIHGRTGKDPEYPFDTLSFPVKRADKLLGVVSFLSLPGILGSERERIALQMKTALRGIVNSL